MAALVVVVAHDTESLVALALVAGPRAVEKALRECLRKEPDTTYSGPTMSDDEFREYDRLMRQRSAGELGSRT